MDTDLKMDENSRLKFPDFLTIIPNVSVKYQLPDHDGSVYHYTDIHGFQGILEDECFWASNIHFQNGNNEYIDGFEKLILLIDEYIESNKNPQIEEYLLKVKEEMQNGYSSRITGEFSRDDIFAISFCRNGDLLSQWRGYGNSSGISIGFDVKELFFNVRFKEQSLYEQEKLPYPKNEIGISLNKVIYDDELKKSILLDVLKFGADFLKPKLNCVDLAVSGVTSSLFLLLPLFKDEGFAEEQEIRYISNLTQRAETRIHFRTRAGILLPYIKYRMLDVNCQPLTKLPISDIVVGPSIQQSLLLESIKYFLRKNNREDLTGKARNSAIPFRG